MKKVLFVCLGNICRSPLAEGLFAEAAAAEGVSHQFEIDSCGTNGLHDGELPDPRTRKNALSHGLTLSHHSRKIQSADLDYYDWILVMDDANKRNVEALCQEDRQKQKIHKRRQFDPKEPNADVQDPWYGGEAGFETVFQVIQQNVHFWLKYLQQESQQ